MPIAITRYANRKLYNRETRAYISLADVAEYLRQGEDVQVIDNVSGEDITTAILAQVISGQEKRRRGRLPGDLLSGILQASEETAARWRAALDWPLFVEDDIRGRIEQLVASGAYTPEDGQRILADLLSVAHNHPIGLDERLTRLLQSRDLPSRRELDLLHQQLDELLDQLA